MESTGIQILPLERPTLSIAGDLLMELWPDTNRKEEEDYLHKSLSLETEDFWLAKAEDTFIGFLLLSLRNEYVEGAEHYPIAYLEGIYLKPSFRRNGIGKQLIKFAEAWGMQKGCSELASDAELINQASIDFHLASGYTKVNRVVCFHKKIRD